MSLKNISLDNLPEAPKAIWAVVFLCIIFVIGALGGFLIVKATGIQDDYDAVVAQENVLKETLRKRQNISKILKAVEEEIKKIEGRLDSARKQLPAELNMDEFVDALAAATKTVGIVVNKLEADKEVKSSFLITQPFKIEGCSGYHQVGSFLSELSQIQRIITFDKFKMENVFFTSISNASSAGKNLSPNSAVKADECLKINLLPFSAVVSTYKYQEAINNTAEAKGVK